MTSLHLSPHAHAAQDRTLDPCDCHAPRARQPVASTQQRDGENVGWPAIISIIIATGVLVGLLLGVVRVATGASGGPAGIGVGMGVVGAPLISRRRAQLRAQRGP